jgi:hypothetical protein
MSLRGEMRRASRTAGFTLSLFTVINALLALCTPAGVIPPERQPTFRCLQELCNQMSSATLSKALAHLERHGWLARLRIGRRIFYVVAFGDPCECRGHPSTSTERMRRFRERRKAEDVTLTRSKDVTPEGSNQEPPTASLSRHKPLLSGPIPLEVSDLSQKPAQVRASALEPDVPPVPPRRDVEDQPGTDATGGSQSCRLAEPEVPELTGTAGLRDVVPARGPVADRSRCEVCGAPLDHLYQVAGYRAHRECDPDAAAKARVSCQTCGAVGGGELGPIEHESDCWSDAMNKLYMEER